MALGARDPAAPALDARTFRDALGRFATGVAFVTAAPGGEPAGLIVNSLASVSLEPPLVSFCPSRSSLTWRACAQARRFGVNVLGREHEGFARRAAPAGADRFAGLDGRSAAAASRCSRDALAALECEIVAEHPAGDHWIVVGRVTRRASRRPGSRSCSSPARSAPCDKALTGRSRRKRIAA